MYSKFCLAIYPYLARVTIKFHLQRARHYGLKLEDIHENRFIQGPAIEDHLYGQYYHPEGYIGKNRDVQFKNRYQFFFKGSKTPDWAQNYKRDGTDIDEYSRLAWIQTRDDMNSEITPQFIIPERLGANPLQWIRWEGALEGFSARLFYNEIPKPFIWRYRGRYDIDPEKDLYSFKHGDQLTQSVFGADHKTPEGRKKLQDIIDFYKAIVPELMTEQYKPMERLYRSQEPHFKRSWSFYRHFIWRQKVRQALRKGDITQDDIDKCTGIFLSNDLIPDPELLAETEAGVYGDEFENFEPYIAMKKIIKAIGFDGFMFRANTSMPFKSQWWRGFDDVYELNEEEMNELIPQIVSPTEGADVSGTYKFDSVETRALA